MYKFCRGRGGRGGASGRGGAGRGGMRGGRGGNKFNPSAFFYGFTRATLCMWILSVHFQLMFRVEKKKLRIL